MSGEPHPKWWNRNLPVNLIGPLLAALLVVGMGYFYLEPFLQTWWWTFQHHSTATYQDLSVKVPWMWREEATLGGQRQLRLVRACLGEPVGLESIVISSDRSISVGSQTIAGSLQELSMRLGQKEFRGTPILVDPKIAEQFSCMAPHFDRLREWQVSCLSKDNLWSANLYGHDSDLDSFKAVLLSASFRH